MTIHESGAPGRPLDVDTDDVAGVLAARRVLGAEAEPAVITEFLNRTGQAIDARVDQRLAARSVPASPAGSGTAREDDRWQKSMALKLALGSILLGFPVTAVATRFAGGGGVAISIVAWVVIAVINIVFNLPRRP
jgi:hypothetical protein